ncbi:hypothetical protein E2C01_053014 [Portunus trituberculatus]|uniref:Secreted protein n=1 Tax=Portunus trituberculatus TaxID=210409 RepID=A0A5B7GN18_PORTR|nr:hypothetical protein [Portunus trituberculatus]
MFHLFFTFLLPLSSTLPLHGPSISLSPPPRTTHRALAKHVDAAVEEGGLARDDGEVGGRIAEVGTRPTLPPLLLSRLPAGWWASCYRRYFWCC